MPGSIIGGLWYRLIHGGGRSLYDVEAFALQKMLGSLREAERKNMLLQLERIDLVQRSPNGKIVALYQASDGHFKSWGEILLKNKDPNLLAFCIKLTGDDCPRKDLTLDVYFHEGHISSIEYRSEVRWPENQGRVSLGGFDWLNYSGTNVSVVSSELTI